MKTAKSLLNTPISKETSEFFANISNKNGYCLKVVP